MSDVSSCVIGPDIAAAHRLREGDELGYFQYGGSTHCLLFEPHVVQAFELPAIPPQDGGLPDLVQVRSRLATVDLIRQTSPKP